MTDDSPFSPWYRPGRPLPVAHPIPWCSATVSFPEPDKIEWRVYNYQKEEVSVETFDFADEWVEEAPTPD